MSSKSWQRPWSIEEIIQNSSNWSLAGDAGLLKHLELFSENLLSQADTTNNNLNDLVSRLNSTCLCLDEVKNDFRSLRNTQFIESRVYEDDETAPESQNLSSDKSYYTGNEDSNVPDLREAILAGINVVDKYFDKVEVPGSDSEDEVVLTSFILKPKDQYADRPLPHIIGTDEWYKKWHVGLIDSSSDSEVDKSSEKYSESDSEGDVAKDNIINHPVANSISDDALKRDLLHASDVSSTKEYFVNKLATKLDNFVDDHANLEEVNCRPINTAPSITADFGNLFSNEPPPIEDFTDNNNVTGLFSGGGLFDDLDNSTNLWNEEKNITSAKTKISNLFDNDTDDDLFNKTISYEDGIIQRNRVGNIKTGGLFDDEDDTLFNHNKSSNKIKVTLSLITDEPPEFEAAINECDIKAKKSIGSVKIMEDVVETQKCGDLVKQRRRNSSSSESDTKPITDNIHQTSPIQKTGNLFGDDDDFEKDLFATSFSKNSVKVAHHIENEVESIPPKPIISSISNTDLIESNDNNGTDNKAMEPIPISLFGVYDDNDKSDDLFSDSLFGAKPRPLDSIPPLFDRNPPELDDNWDSRSDNNIFEDNDTGLFDNIPEMSSHRSGLFDNEPPSLFFESSGIVIDINTRVTTDESFSPNASSSRRFSSDIFNEQQLNDSFFVTKNEIQSNLDIIPETSHTQAINNYQSKIEVTPSGIEDDLFNSTTGTSRSISAHIVCDEHIFPRNVNNTIENSLSVASPGKLKHNLKINVNALVPGASPPKKPSVQKTVSLEVPSTEEESIKRLSLKSTVEPTTFENLVKDVEVLPSIVKTRAKIPFKRTPSTRKGRQKSIRTSVSDFKILTCNNDGNIPHSESDEFVDIFAEDKLSGKAIDGIVDQQGIKENENVNVVSVAKKVVSLEEIPKQTVIDFPTDDYKELNLFDDSEDFEDIFSAKKLPPRSNIVKALFSNDSDDDDNNVFGCSSTITKDISNANVTNNSKPKKTIKTIHVKKLVNSEVVEDPLSLFLEE